VFKPRDHLVELDGDGSSVLDGEADTMLIARHGLLLRPPVTSDRGQTIMGDSPMPTFRQK